MLRKFLLSDTIEVDGKRGIIRFIGSGSVQIDYNHRYAGKTILLMINVVQSLESTSDKIDGILKNRLPVDSKNLI